MIYSYWLLTLSYLTVLNSYCVIYPRRSWFSTSFCSKLTRKSSIYLYSSIISLSLIERRNSKSSLFFLSSMTTYFIRRTWPGLLKILGSIFSCDDLFLFFFFFFSGSSMAVPPYRYCMSCFKAKTKASFILFSLFSLRSYSSRYSFSLSRILYTVSSSLLL